MTFEFILKNNPSMKNFKEEITSMMKEIILPAYSNLGLCYLKMERWNLVIMMSNQVLTSDPDNLKNLYRRGIARKMTRMCDEAIEDFQKVATMDDEMAAECRRQIAECKEIRKEVKRKNKQLASNLISGYSEDKPDPKPLPDGAFPPTLDDMEKLVVPHLPWWLRCLNCLYKLWPRWLSR
jgi:tetratricopeptide (TPR) repeat protein